MCLHPDCPAPLLFADPPAAATPAQHAGPGILEIKCPFNKGSPQTALPPQRPQWYYMPQVLPMAPNP